MSFQKGRKHCEKRSKFWLSALFPSHYFQKAPFPVNSLPHHSDLTTWKKKSFENIVEKGETAGNQHFLLFPQCFLPFPKQISIFFFHLIFCRLQVLWIWTSLEFCCLVKSKRREISTTWVTGLKKFTVQLLIGWVKGLLDNNKLIDFLISYLASCIFVFLWEKCAANYSYPALIIIDLSRFWTFAV